MDDLIAKLVQELGLTAEEITDILWLALLQWQSTKKPPTYNFVPPLKPNPDTPSPTDKLDSSQHPGSSNPDVKPNPPKAPLYPRPPQSPSKSPLPQESLPFPVPNARAIRNSRELLRSLRPLMQRVPSQTSWILDEEATVQCFAETRLWLPQRKPKQEPWFELALVIDASPSMLIWQRHVIELQRLLAQTGAFRDVRTWSLDVNSNGKLYLHPKLRAQVNYQAPRSPEELIDPTRRRLILVVSDCISTLWQSGTVTTALKIWAEHGPMALVQMLPESLWDRTALSEVPKVRLHSLVPGMTNQKLLVVRRDRWRKTTSRDIKVPVLTLEPPITSLWSQMVAGKGNIRAPGLLFSLVEQTSFHLIETISVDLPSEERVQRFRVFSSSIARRLAGLLAACPVVSLPVIRIIQDAMVPQSQQVHVAEVLLSGLFGLATSIKADTHPDEIEYRFYDEGIRGILLDSTPAPDTFKVLSKWIEERLGKSLDDFIAILTNPQSNSALVEQTQPFAGVAIEVLKRQGGSYARFAADLELRLLPPIPAPPSFTEGFPPIQTFEFEVATITIEDETEPSSGPNLQPFEFEVATIELKKSGFLGRETELRVKPSRQRATRFSEDLGNGIQLEMVLIPEGSFLMGSPENELERLSCESPQHRVNISSFCMGKYPVTLAQWQSVASLPQVKRKLNPDPSRFIGANRPVERVSWYDASEFCDRLSRYTEKPYRLPSEAEWEYACRAGTTTPFHFGETIISELANYNGEVTYAAGSKGVYRQETTPVGSFGVANAFGLYDMHGNTCEWCADYWHKNYKGAPSEGNAWSSSGDNDNQMRVLRGGSWNDRPASCRSAYRFRYSAFNESYIGFRVVCGLPPKTL